LDFGLECNYTIIKKNKKEKTDSEQKFNKKLLRMLHGPGVK
jgi:hypothetical protein